MESQQLLSTETDRLMDNAGRRGAAAYCIFDQSLYQRASGVQSQD